MGPMSLFPPPKKNAASAWAGRRVGLFGGSFNPPHDGHLLVARRALAGLCLDCVWWLVSPHNPLKDPGTLLPFAERMDLCRALTAGHPRMLVSGIEEQYGLGTTYNSLRFLRENFPRTNFVFLAGLDNALSFHRWHRWRDILQLTALAYVIRPPVAELARRTPLRRQAGPDFTPIRAASRVLLAPGRVYGLLEGPVQDLASSEIRNLNNNSML